MKIWRLSCSFAGDPLHTWGYYQYKPTIEALLLQFKDYWSIVSLSELDKLISEGKLKHRYDEFYLEEIGVIENEMGF